MRGLRWIAAAVVALVVAAGIYVATLDPNAYKAEIQAALEAATGRAVEIEGPLGLTWTPGPSLAVSGVRIANVDWGSERAMATVGDLAVGVELLPLLAGHAEVSDLRLSDVRVLLERDARGRGNWQFGGSTDAAASPARIPDIRQAELARVSLVWKDGPKAPERVYRIDRLSLRGSDDDGGLSVALAAELDGDPIEIEGTVPAFADLFRSGIDLPIAVNGRLAETAVSLGVVLKTVAAAGDAGGSLQVERLEASFGDLAVTGSGTVVFAGTRPLVTADLQAGTLDFDRLKSAGGPNGNPLDRPLPFDLLTAVDARLGLKVVRLVAGGLAVDGLTATAKLDNGLLTLDPVAGKLADGALAGRLVLDGRKQPGRLALAATAGGMDMGAVYTALTGEALIQGAGDVVLDLQGGGGTPRALLGSSKGVARLVVRNGVILNRYWELIAEDVATRFLPFVGEADRGRLNCLVGRFDIAKGIADASVLMVDSDRVTVAGEGTVDLAAQTLDMRLVPRPKDPSLFSLATPILLTGPLADPRPAPDPVALAKGLGGIAAGTALGPIGLLLPFISAGSADDPCPAAIAAAEGKRRPARSSSEPDKPGGIKGLFEGLRKAIE